jgi:hypothetical protein
VSTAFRTSAATAALVFAAALVLGLASAGCGAGATATSKPKKPPRPVDHTLLALAPAGAQMVLWIDVEQLRASPLWEAIRLGLDDDEYREIEAATGIDLINKIDEILISAAQRPDGEDEFVAAVKGRIDARTAMQTVIRSKKGAAEARGETEVIETERFFVFAATKRTAIVCSKNAVDRAVGLANRRGRSLLDDTGFADLPIEGDAAALLRFRRGPEPPDLSRFGARSPIEDIDKITELDASLVIGDGIDVAWSYNMADKLTAASNARELRRLCKNMSRNAFAMLIGFDWIFDRIKVKAEGTWVNVRIVLDSIDLEQIRRLAARLRKIRDLTEPGEGDLDRRPKMLIPRTDRPLMIPPAKPRPGIEGSGEPKE